MKLYSRLIVLSFAACAAASSLAFTITPGTVLGIDGPSRELVEYAFDGTITETIAVTGLEATPVGLTVLGNRVFVGDVNGRISEVNLTTGAIFGTFLGNMNEGLGDDGTNLLALNYNTGVVSRYTSNGTFVDSFSTNAGGTGVDGSSSRVVTANYNDGKIYSWDFSGNNLGSFATGLSGLSGLGYDATTGYSWVASGFGDDRIRAYDASGTLVANFATNRPWINGLDVVPAVPEPATMAVLGVGLLALRRRKK